MKTDRRHELQKNELADSLGHWIESVRPYNRMIAGAMIAAAVLLFGYAYVSAKSTQKLANGWTAYLQAFNTGDRDKLTTTAEKYPGTPVASWSNLIVADMRLNEGSNQILKNKSDARESLRRAAEGYQDVYDHAREPLVLQRALFGLARAHEGLGELDESKAAYEKLLKRWPDGPLKEVAAKRVAALGETSTKQFYDWLAKYEPKSLDKEPGTPGLKSEFNSSLLENPHVDASKIELLTPKTETTEKPEGDAKPAETTDKPKADQPPADKPADTKSADEKPADAKPADAKPADEAKPEAPKADAPKSDGPSLTPEPKPADAPSK